ncbi:lysophospholipid acyltransferase family protein [Planosporangium mesophilum]|uniref:1-acyl-sn-glycerol-3-phosphate acyltransferase n=1 Tax=Planosporangium mesophilum TaxID=689768 RepID=A0A8J3X178_9ACTN|nr:lysophospholipid acyltransferase family protein [Planosporangium mesophilum]NJC85407.1 1-acyl-sn-glycerol-3-phosphate acyltransferase [Planosporangium mesophilum]GII24082.1 1-acyl-sn-glycerol-3-phosphate acyltransferase [Planosporangium mesophilum]
MPPLYALAKLTVGNLLRLFWRPVVEGLEHVPRRGGVILAGNHLSVADELFLAAVLPRHIAFWAKAEYFSGGWLTRTLVSGVGAIPVERGGGRAALAAFDAAVPVLRAGGVVAVYPEGTRSPDGRLYRGRTGVVRLARQAEVPIVPVGVTGTDKVQPIDARLPRLNDVTFRFGRPLEVAGRIDGPADIRAVTDELMAEIQKLSGQEYVPRYAPKRGTGPA